MEINAEQSVVGSLLIDPRVAGYVFSNSEAEDFKSPELREIYSAARAMFMVGEIVDAAVVGSRLGSKYSAIMVEMMQLTPTAANIEAYVAALRESRKLRDMQAIAMQVLSSKSSGEAAVLLSGIEAAAVDRCGVMPMSFDDGMSELMGWLSDAAPPGYLDWGIPELNSKAAVEPGDFVVLGADSSTGKTAFALQLAFNLAEQGKRVGFFSLETSTRKAYQRVAALAADIDFQEIKYKKNTQQNVDAIRKAQQCLGKLPLDIINLPGASVSEVRAITLARHYDVIFIDYVQLMSDEAKDRYDKVTNISMNLHTMAQHLSVTVIALSQVTVQTVKTRDGKERTVPVTRDDLRDSRQLKQDADLIVMMSKVGEHDDRRWLVVDKNKDGDLGKLCMRFDYRHMRFSPCDAPGDSAFNRVQKACAKINTERREEERQVTLREISDDDPLPF